MRLSSKAIQILASAFLTTFFASLSAQALNVCLYARANQNPTSGHSFVTLENDRAEVVESYGFWPEKYNKNSLFVNFYLDNPMRTIDKMRNEPGPTRRLGESRICQNVPGLTVQKARTLVANYKPTYGPYRYLKNNCSHFAVRLYNAASGDTFPVSKTPSGIMGSIKKVYLAKVRSYSDYRRLHSR